MPSLPPLPDADAGGLPPLWDPPDPTNLPIVVTPPPAAAIPEMFTTALPDDIRNEIAQKVHEFAGTRKAVTTRRKRFRRASWQKK